MVGRRSVARCFFFFFWLTHISSLSHRLWQVALSRVVVGTGTAGIEFLVAVVINGKSHSLSFAWALADRRDLVQLYELPLWTSAAVLCGTVGFKLRGPVGAALTDRLGFRP